jgi:hypothetical protein
MIERICWFDLRESQTFLSIRKLVLRELAGVSDDEVASLSEKEIAKLVSVNPSDIRTRNDVMLRLEAMLVKLLRDCELRPYGALQFPANVRVLNALRRRASREEYSTEHLHCDAWSGAPSDSWNHLLYILAEPGCPRLEMREPLPIGHPLREYVGPYDESVTSQVAGVKATPIPCRAGVLVAWPTYTPHRTDYQSTSLTDGSTLAPTRVSVDFRARMGHPYVEDRNCPIGDFASTKMNSAGMYWTYRDRQFLDFEEKAKFELSVASQQSSDALRRRREYFAVHYEGLSGL